jgi:hypothetical protein
MMEDFKEIAEKIEAKVPAEVDKSALKDFVKSLEPKPKS